MAGALVAFCCFILFFVAMVNLPSEVNQRLLAKLYHDDDYDNSLSPPQQQQQYVVVNS